MNQLNSICVFCGSSFGKRPEYAEAATALGRELAQRKIRLVYGGGSVGLMGAMATVAESAGGDVLSIIPRALIKRELAGDSIGELVLVDTMLERKTIMAQKADAFLTMPGGFGTFDELFEMVTWGQLGVQAKPMGLLNVAGYFDAMVQQIDHAIAEGFIQAEYRDLLVEAEQPNALLDKLIRQEVPSGITQWIDKKQGKSSPETN